MSNLPPIPAKRYFTISEVALLCDVKPHVLRYWEQEFVQLRPMKRRGNRRYYQHHELLMVRRIRTLLYDEGFTIQGARNQLRATSGTGAVEDLEACSPPSPAMTIAAAEISVQTLPLCASMPRTQDWSAPAALQHLRQRCRSVRFCLYSCELCI